LVEEIEFIYHVSCASTWLEIKKLSQKYDSWVQYIYTYNVVDIKNL